MDSQTALVQDVVKLLETKTLIRLWVLPTEPTGTQQKFGEYASQLVRVSLVDVTPVPRHGQPRQLNVFQADVYIPKPWGHNLPDEVEPWWIHSDTLDADEYPELVRRLVHDFRREVHHAALTQLVRGAFPSFAAQALDLKTKVWTRLPWSTVVAMDLAMAFERIRNATRGVHPLQHFADASLLRLQAAISTADRS